MRREPDNLNTYRHASLVLLAERIVRDNDRGALREMHSRPLFRSDKNSSLRLVEFVSHLSESPLARDWSGRDAVALDLARDLTMDKFHNLPSAAPEKHSPADSCSPNVKCQGPDCRCYYAAFLDYVARRVEPAIGQLAAEAAAAEALRSLVKRHFRLSCLECNRRSDGRLKRVFWRIQSGQEVCLMFPTYMSGDQCNKWLKAQLEDYESADFVGRDQIQRLIDRQLVLPSLLSLDQKPCEAERMSDPKASLPCSVLAELSVTGLAQVVADEKCASMDAMRPSIRALGATALHDLIHEVFASLAGGDSADGQLAAAFGLSKATFSRFAGSRLRAPRHEENAVPDLWRNTAQVLSRVPVFIEAAEEAGVMAAVKAMLPAPLTIAADGHE